MPACRLHELAKVLFQTCEAKGTGHTRVPGVHTSEEASRELVKGQCQRQRLYAAAGCDATSMKCFDMSSSMRVESFFIAYVFVCGMNLRSLHGTERMRGIIFLWGKWMFPEFWRKVLCEFTVSFLRKYCWRHAPCHLTQMTAAWTWT